MRKLNVVAFTAIMILSVMWMPLSMGSPQDNATSSVPVVESMAPHAPIRVNDNADFPGIAASGDGSAGSPWIIENYEINGTGVGYCIYVGNTTEHFIVRNCTLNSSSGVSSPWQYFGNSGLNFFNVANGKAHNCTILYNAIFGAYISASNNVTISKCNASYSAEGITFSDTVYSTIANCTMYNNDDGVWFTQATRYNTVYNNTAAGGSSSGILLNHALCRNNAIINNTVSYNDEGIMLTNSDNNTVSGNIGHYCWGWDAIAVTGCLNTVIDNNTMDGNEVAISIDGSDFTYIRDNSGQGNDVFIDLRNSDECEIIGNNGSWCNQVGLSSGGTASNNNVISNNDFWNNTWHGIYWTAGQNNLISNNTASGNQQYGIYVWDDNNVLDNNTASYNTDGGFHIRSSGNIITNNTASDNPGDGMRFRFAAGSSNTVSLNDIANNNGYGLYLFGTNSNTIYHNNIINNAVQAFDDGVNAWDNGYPSGGNYWDDYAGVDNFKGPNQDIPGGDGIGDTDYTNIAGGAGAVDEYPLMASPGLAAPISNLSSLVFGYWNMTGSVNVSWQATDDIGLSNISLMYSHSSDNSTGWTGWLWDNISSASGMSDSGNFTFSCPQGRGYYQLRTNATDVLNKAETDLTDIVEFSYTPFQPDIMINGSVDDLYEVPGGGGGGPPQQMIMEQVNRSDYRSYNITVQNDGLFTDNITVIFSNYSMMDPTWGFWVWDMDTPQNITDLIGGKSDMFGYTNWTNVILAPGQSRTYSINISVPADAPFGQFGAQLVIAVSMNGIENGSFSMDFVMAYLQTWSADYLKITDAPDGTEITDQTVPIGMTIKGYASAYSNDPGIGYLGLARVNWTLLNFDGAGAFDSDPVLSYNNTFNASTAGGYAYWQAKYEYSFTNMDDEVETIWLNSTIVNITIDPPALDFIVITDSPDGTALGTVSLLSGGTVTAYASGYNSTGPTYVGLVDVTWTDVPDLGSFDNDIGTNTVFTAGATGGTTTITGQNGTLAVVDTFSVDITETTLPTTTISIGTPNHTTVQTYVNSSTEFNLTATDTGGSGLASTWYRLWNGTWTAWTLYTGNFTLTGQDGTMHIRYNSTDNAGNDEAPNNQTVILDNSGPTSVFNISAPNYINGTTTFANSSTVFNVTADDATGSGVASIWWRIWCAPDWTWSNWTQYSANLSAEEEGLHYVEHYATDNLGQNGTVVNVTLVIDNSTPVTTLLFIQPVYGSVPRFITSTTGLNFTATDGNGSGVANIVYRIDSGSWVNHTGVYYITSPGPHNLEYRATDNLGQNETVQTIALLVDDTAPVTSIDFGTPYYNGSIYINSTTEINLSSLDFGSGPGTIWYLIDNAASYTSYSGIFTIASEGLHTITYNARDNLGNTEADKTITVTVDNTAPTASIAIGQPRSGSSPTYVTSSTEFNLSATDVHSGVDSIWFRIDTGTYTLYTDNFTVTVAGSHTLNFYTIDNLGQSSAESSLQIFVDDTPPVILPVSGTTEVSVGGTIPLSTSDTGVGGELIYFSTDDGATWTLYPGPIAITDNITILFYAEDALGNRGATHTLTVTIPGETSTPPAADSFIEEYWWILLIIVIVLLLLPILFLLGRKKEPECQNCGSTTFDKTSGGTQICAKCGTAYGEEPDDPEDDIGEPEDPGEDITEEPIEDEVTEAESTEPETGDIKEPIPEV